jgi:hypothetical protein
MQADIMCVCGDVYTHASASSGAGPMELVSMACPSVVRGRIIINKCVCADV